MANINMRQLLEAGVHFGHQTRFWHPKMAPFIYGQRNKIHIINLDHTLKLFRETLNFVSSVAGSGGQILFVGTKRSAQQSIAREASRAGMPYVSKRWLGGMLTNFKTVKQSIRRLHDFEKLVEDPTFFVFVQEENQFTDNLKFNSPFYIISHDAGYRGSWERLTSQAHCKHHIFNNSTFYFWGAIFSQFLNKRLDIESQIFVTDNFIFKEIYCPDWKKF